MFTNALCGRCVQIKSISMSLLKSYRLSCNAESVARREESMNFFPANDALVDRIPKYGHCLFLDNQAVIEMYRGEKQKCRTWKE